MKGKSKGINDSGDKENKQIREGQIFLVVIMSAILESLMSKKYSSETVQYFCVRSLCYAL